MREVIPEEKSCSTPGEAGLTASFLRALRCPYCGSRIEVCGGRRGEGAIEYGWVRCACHEYPIVEGILILRQMDGLDRILDLVRRNEPRRALLQSLNVFRFRWALRSRWHQLHYHLNCRRLLSAASATFAEAAQLVRGPKVFADYLVHRFANPSFLGAIGTMLLLRGLAEKPGRWAAALDVHAGCGAETGPRFLDVGCGAGHSSFILQALYPGSSVISADTDFVSLYLARRYLVLKPTLVCWDAEIPSPFPDGWFDAVFCLDAFHYFGSKRVFVTELKRVLTPRGVWLFPHLHNRLQPNFVAGIPLSPEGYLECFGLPEGRLFDETQLLRDLSQARLLDLRDRREPAELNRSPALTFVSGPSELWSAHEGFPSLLCQPRLHLEVNPIYQGRRTREHLELELSWPNRLMSSECRGAESVLPARCRLALATLAEDEAEDGVARSTVVEDLVAQFVLVPLPRNYTRRRATR